MAQGPHMKFLRTKLRLWIRRELLALVLVPSVLIVVGATYQAIALRRDRRRYPSPGQMVDVGGHRLHLQVTDQDRSAPTVVLEAGLGFPSVEWAWVRQEVAHFARVVAYDRAGVAWSASGPKPRDGQRIAQELYAALHAAGIEGPYVLVAHSFGGLFVRAFADLSPEEVAGMVLVDSSHPDQLERSPLERRAQLRFELMIKVAPYLARLGVLRIYALRAKWIRELPPEQAAQMRAFVASAEFWVGVGAEAAAWEESTSPQVRRARSLGDMPLAVLTAPETVPFDPVHEELQAELALLSSNSTHHVVDGADHGSIVMSPQNARVVADYVWRVAEAVRSGRPLGAVGSETAVAAAVGTDARLREDHPKKER
jgi:pimeloyl-ACP methyl ester carboxylesterase